MKKNLIVFALVVTGLVMGGCAKVPQMEIDAVEVAIEKAKVAEADLYLPAEFAAVQDSMSAINAEVETQKSKMFGSYKAVNVKLAALQIDADALEGQAIAKKEQVKEEVNMLYAAMLTLATENNALLMKAPKGKEGKVVIEAIKGELTAIDASIAEVPALIESGNLLGAQTKLKAIQEKATAINAELLAVIEKYTKR